MPGPVKLSLRRRPRAHIATGDCWCGAHHKICGASADRILIDDPGAPETPEQLAAARAWWDRMIRRLAP